MSRYESGQSAKTGLIDIIELTKEDNTLIETEGVDKM